MTSLTSGLKGKGFHPYYAATFSNKMHECISVAWIQSPHAAVQVQKGNKRQSSCSFKLAALIFNSVELKQSALKIQSHSQHQFHVDPPRLNFGPNYFLYSYAPTRPHNNQKYKQQTGAPCPF